MVRLGAAHFVGKRLPISTFGFGHTLILVVLVLSVLSRLAGYENRILSRDEAFSWRMSRYSPSGLLQHMPGDAHPPLYYFVLKAWTEVASTSPAGMRTLSVLLSVAALVPLYFVCREFVGADGAWCAVLLAGLHAEQVAVAPVARMYSLGVFLSATTAWLLSRALRADAWHSSWWTGYGLAVTAFCYTHYFAFFTILGQSIFVASDLIIRSRSTERRQIRSSWGGFLYAGCMAALLFAPWFPVLLAQARDVYQTWWVGPLTALAIDRALFSWFTGVEYQGALVSHTLLGAFAVLMLWTVARGGRPAWFFLLQAIVPWAAALTLSLLGRQTIVQDRYFVFSQIGLFGLWSVSWSALSRVSSRLLLAMMLGSIVSVGLADQLDRLPNCPPALQIAAEWLNGQDVDGDLFIMDDFTEINVFRYYTTFARLPWLDVKGYVGLFTKGHVVHLASLESSDVVWSEEQLWRHAPPRVWLCSTRDGRTPTSFPGHRYFDTLTFSSCRTRFTLARYDRK